MRLLVQRSGAQPEIAEAEWHAVLDADGYVWRETARHGRLVVGELETAGGARPALGEVVRTVARLAYTTEVTRHRFTARREIAALTEAAAMCPLDTISDAPTFAVRAARADAGDKAPPRRKETEETLGRAWSVGRQVDLRDPRLTMRAWIVPDGVMVGEPLWIDTPGAFEARATKRRPFFSPVSGHPRLMRALCNLGGRAPGATIYDPLCGTGGILLEAALAGFRAVGSDLDPRMVEGTTANLAHAGVEASAVFAADVRDAPDAFRRETGTAGPDAIVTDLPYGQSASTGKAGAAQVAAWTLEAIQELLPVDHRAVVGVADTAWLDDLPSGLERRAAFPVRVHKSLTRTYVVLQAVA